MESVLQTFLIVVAITSYTAQATLVQNVILKLEAGKSFTGEIGAAFTVLSDAECALRCSSDDACKVYQYTISRRGNCLLIHRNSTAENGQTFSTTAQNILYKKVCATSLPWTPPPEWTAPDPVVYRSFDCPDGLMMMEGNQQANILFIAGKIKDAVSLDHTRSQWIDLGILNEVCMARPGTCGAAGGAVVFWMRITYLDHKDHGILSSRSDQSTENFKISTGYNYVWYGVGTPDGSFETGVLAPSGWIHIVMNYIGPNNGQGIMIYHDGVLTESDDTKSGGTNPPGNGRVVVGRFFTNFNLNYAGVDMDELLFFNEKLSVDEIMNINNII